MFECIRSRLIEWRRRRKAAATHSEPSAPDNSNPLLERAGLTGISAGMSGTVVSVITTPIDVIKTRVMLAASNNKQRGNEEQDKQDKEKERKKKKRSPRGTWAVGKEIFREEGIRGLFRGGAIRAGWTALSLSMYLTIYEGSRFYLENRRNEKDAREKGDRQGGETGV